tara:strand:+ start:147 stop:572 length:426 start_codon:yes stop_codon:yes gene_type:complete
MRKLLALTKNNYQHKNLLQLFISSTFGLASLVLPTFFLTEIKQHDSPLFPIIATSVNGFSIWSIFLLAISGFIISLFSKIEGWKIGLSTMALFPIMTIIEMIVDTSSHNLFPFEFIFYAVLTIPSIIGAYIAKGLKNLVKN